MATYAIGDIHGCYQSLIALLNKINFDPHRDSLWSVGDLINRGPDSLKVLKFFMSLPNTPVVTLGNHDLHCLAIVLGDAEINPKDTLDAILNSPNRDKYIDFLRQQKCFHYDETLNTAMVHAGVHPHWTLQKALALSQELENTIQSDGAHHFFKNMYGNKPNAWHDDLTGIDRLRAITNYLTRTRICDTEGKLKLSFKGLLKDTPQNYFPWYEIKPRTIECDILFGHWAALNGQASDDKVIALDTGCVWGNRLTAVDVQRRVTFEVGYLG